MRFLLGLCGRRTVAVLFATSFGALLLDLLGIALVFPFLHLVMSPELVEATPALSRLRALLGVESPRALTIIVGVVLVAAYALRFGLKLALTAARSRETSRATLALVVRLFSDLLRARYAVFTEHSTSEMLAVVNGHTIHSFLCLDAVVRIVTEALLLALVGAALLVLDPVAFAALFACFAVIGTVLYVAVVRRLSQAGARHAALNVHVYKLGFAVASSIKDIKIMSMEGGYADRFAALWGDYSRNDASVKTLRTVPADLSETLVFTGLIGASLYLIATRDDLVASLPALGVLAVAALRVLPSFNRIAASYNEFRYYQPSLALVEELWTRIQASPQVVRALPLPFTSGLELRDVTLRYGEVTVLDGVSARIPRGRAVAFVGPSGAGKSTLLDVIVGIRQCDRGEFTLDGVPFDPFTTDAVRRLVGYVPQTVNLVDDTIAFNVALDPRHDPERLARALELARLTGFVSALPDGVRTVVGEGGVRVSGGQRQRIGIARALYRDPAVLVLDEATSALDAATERALMDEVTQLAGAKTLIIVAHRLATVERCDAIHLLESGRIVAVGSHAELLAGCERYRDLYRHQEAGSAATAQRGEAPPDE